LKDLRRPTRAGLCQICDSKLKPIRPTRENKKVYCRDRSSPKFKQREYRDALSPDGEPLFEYWDRPKVFGKGDGIVPIRKDDAGGGSYDEA
jgi:hypothetical protein